VCASPPPSQARPCCHLYFFLVSPRLLRTPVLAAILAATLKRPEPPASDRHPDSAGNPSGSLAGDTIAVSPRQSVRVSIG
jgi:hypothetical protein